MDIFSVSDMLLNFLAVQARSHVWQPTPLSANAGEIGAHPLRVKARKAK
jgi:hypothetical protein